MGYHYKKGGIVTETGAKEIPLFLSKENLRHLLLNAISGNSEFTHQDICHWCCKHYSEILTDDSREVEDFDIDQSTLNVIADVDAQWDLYLVNTYSISELQTLDLSSVKLPSEWLVDWLKQLE